MMRNDMTICARSMRARHAVMVLGVFAVASWCRADGRISIWNREGGYYQISERIPQDAIDEFKNLDKESSKALLVEWDKVSYTSTGDILISGTLRIRKGDAKLPAGWHGVGVLICTSPGKNVDWSKGFAGVVDFCEYCIVREDGKFAIPIARYSIDRPIGKKGLFQVGIVLAKVKDGNFVWESRDPVLAQSVSHVSIDGQERLSRELIAINSVPSSIGWEYDPLAMIQAVNYLQSLNKPKVIASLREFIQKANPDGPIVRIRECIDTSDRGSLELLIPLLFTSDIHGQSPPLTGPSSMFRITVVDGIPFHNVRFGGIGKGAGTDSSKALVDWAEKKGVLRSSLFRPSDNPLESANKLVEMIAERHRQLGASPPTQKLKAHIRRQSWKMVRELVEPGGKDRSIDDDLFQDDDKWKSLVIKVRKREPYWDEKAQKYAARK